MIREIERHEIIEDEHLEYLDDLRESGVTNMYGAGQYLEDEFEMTSSEAFLILIYWMSTFSERHGICLDNKQKLARAQMPNRA